MDVVSIFILYPYFKGPRLVQGTEVAFKDFSLTYPNQLNHWHRAYGFCQQYKVKTIQSYGEAQNIRV